MSGYVSDTPYANTFFRELSPAWLNYVAALNGVRPRPLDAPFTYLELGCGFGTSAVINAASFPQASFHACDFNEDHIAGARAYADRLGISNIILHARTFESLLVVDLPRFDFIALHGVYSWVSASDRDVIRRLIERLLLPGGLVYVSFNALPGWSHELPLRKLLVELAATIDGTAAVRSEGAAAAIEHLSGARLRYFTANPAAASAVGAYMRGEGHYLAHEFMNAAWEPFYGVDVGDDFAAIGLQSAGSATLAANHLPLIVDAGAAAAIGALPTTRQQQLAIDFATNQRFRRDVFVWSNDGRREERYLEDAVIGCITDVDAIGSTARVPRGEIHFQEPFIRDVQTLMANGSSTIGDAVRRLSARGHDKAAILRNLLFLVASGVLMPFARSAGGSETERPSRIASAVVERALRAAAEGEHGRGIVPSPVYGNGVEVDAEDARAVLDWAQRGSPPDVAIRQLTTFARLGLVV